MLPVASERVHVPEGRVRISKASSQSLQFATSHQQRNVRDLRLAAVFRQISRLTNLEPKVLTVV